MDNHYIAVPAWWDPKQRKLLFDVATIVPGILVADRAGVAFASLGGIEFEIPAASLHVTWRAWGTSCRLGGPPAYLVYLAPPGDGVPQLSSTALLEIADRVTTARDLGELADHLSDLGDLADVLGVAGAVGDAVKAYASISAVRRAKRNHQALKDHFARMS